MQPNPERAAELRGEIEKGFAKIIPRIWPKCSRIVSVGTGAFSFYKDKLRGYTGGIPFNNGFFATSEALIGRSMGDETEEYALYTEGAFFEFLEPGTDGTPTDADHVVCGKDYEVILTNDAGLYRYRMGDVINIRRIEQGVPIYTYEYRLNEQCEVGGIRVNERDLTEAVRHIAEHANTEIRDFCAMGEEDRLELFIELSPDAAQEFMKLGEEERARLTDEGLCAASSTYADGRKMGVLRSPVLRILQPETHLLYRDRSMFREKIAPDQIKPVRVLGTEEKKKFFLALTEGES